VEKGGGVGGGGVGGTTWVPGPDLIAKITEFVTSCMPSSTLLKPSWTLGWGVCMDAHCANLLKDILFASGAAPLLLKAGAAAAAAGSIGAAWSAACASAGGPVTLIIALFVQYLRHMMAHRPLHSPQHRVNIAVIGNV